MIAKEAWDAVNTCTPYHPASFVQGYIAGAESREKRIAELEAQIEKMKCCSNCVYLAGCDLSGYEECKNFDKWELREKKEK